MKRCRTCGSNGLIWCPVMLPVSKCCYTPHTPCFVFLSMQQNSIFISLFCWLKITRGIFPRLSQFPGMPPALHWQENANRRILNQITQNDSVALVRCHWHYRGLLLNVENPIRLWISLELKAHRLQNDSFKCFDQTALSPNSSGTEDKLRRSKPYRGWQEVVFILG